jgi:hypothetical protein
MMASGKNGIKKNLVLNGNEAKDLRQHWPCIADVISTIWAKKTKSGTLLPFPAFIFMSQLYKFIN